MARIKVKNISNVTLDQAQTASRLVAEHQTNLDKIEAEMNEKINLIKSKYSKEITDLQDALIEPTELLHVFAKEQKDNWGKKKSMELLHCTIGFRMGTPAVTKNKKFTWDAVVELMKKNPLFKPFIRTKEEVKKDAILALNVSSEKDKKVIDALKDECYVYVEQEESFFVTPKKEEIAP